jgi:hypothetical protein
VELLSKFNREGRTPRAEALCSSIFRRMRHKIEKRLSRTDYRDKRLLLLNEFIDEVDILIDLNRNQLEMQEECKAQPKSHARYNKQEMRRLLENPLLNDIYNEFVEGLLSAPDEIKLKVFNLTTWPEDGNESMLQILRTYFTQDPLEDLIALDTIDVSSRLYDLV